MHHNEEDFDRIDFTFYGDLLGTSNFFSVNMDLAIDRLHYYYNTVFEIFKDVCQQFNKKELSIFLFSDSIFVTGDKLKTSILHLAHLYRLLFWKQIFLRGAMVNGRLEYEPRVELRNLTKKLPMGDVLFRAVALEKYAKGARLLIDKDLARILLPKEWLTDELYSKHVTTHSINNDDFRRRIVLHREWRSYEYLWPWKPGPRKYPRGDSEMVQLMRDPDTTLSRLAMRVPRVVSHHYIETKDLFEFAEQRRKLTEDAFS